MTLEFKLKPLKEIMPEVIFWLKPDGKHYCSGRLKRNIDKVERCIKVNYYPYGTLDCKYLQFNYDFPQLSVCEYKK